MDKNNFPADALKVDVSIIIVSWNTADILRNCLRSIYANTEEITYEVIVVDNASRDGSPDMVQNEFSKVVLIRNSDNRGFASANNQGIQIAQGRYILLLNSDTEVLDNAIPKTIVFSDAHPDAAVVGCRVLNPDRTLQPTCFMFPSVFNMLLSGTYLYKLFPKSRFWGREAMSWWNRDDVRPVDVVTGCYMLINPQAIRQVGMMDEGYFMYCEETDWCYRFKKAGWGIYFTPFPEIIHLGGASTSQKSHEMTLQLRHSKLRFLRKHRGAIAYGAGCALTALYFFLRIPYWLGRALFSRQNRSRCLQVSRTYLAGIFSVFSGNQVFRTDGRKKNERN